MRAIEFWQIWHTRCAGILYRMHCNGPGLKSAQRNTRLDAPDRNHVGRKVTSPPRSSNLRSFFSFAEQIDAWLLSVAVGWAGGGGLCFGVSLLSVLSEIAECGQTL